MKPAKESTPAHRRWTGARLFTAVAALLALGVIVASSYLPADRLRGHLQAELERVLGRRVEIQGNLRLRAMPRPGISAANVLVHEDPRFGPEPFLYADALSFDLGLSSLWRGRLEFREIVAAGASLNLSKLDSGAWNLESVLQSLLAVPSAAGSSGVRISLEEGRINFKTGGEKHALHLRDVDLGVEPSTRRAELAIRFAGGLARTDRPANSFVRLSGRGRVKFLDHAGGRIVMNVALERTAVADLAAAAGGARPAVEGFLSCSAEVEGDLSRLEIKGRMQLQQMQRWAWLWPAGDAWGLAFAGAVDLTAGEVYFRTPLSPADPLPLSIRFRLHDIWRDLKWGSIVVLNRAPLRSAVNLVAQLGLELPESLKLDGELTGALGYSPASGVQGMIRVDAARVDSGGGAAVEIPQAFASLGRDAWRIAPTAVSINGHEGTTVGLAYGLSERRFTLEIYSRGAPLDASIRCWRALAGSPPPPALEQLQEGSWRGSLMYRVEPDIPPRWEGDLLVRNAAWRTPLFDNPVRIQTASMALRGPNLQVQSMQGQLGEASLTGQYRFLESSPYPHRLRFAMNRMDSRMVTGLIGKLNSPEKGLFSRALRMTLAKEEAVRPLGPAEVELAVEELVLSDQQVIQHLVLWCFLDADRFHVRQLEGEWRGGKVSGDVEFPAANRGSAACVGRFRWENVNWGGGTLDGEAIVTRSSAACLPLEDFEADGWFRLLARDVSGGEELSDMTACFFAAARGGRTRWSLEGVSAQVGGERYSGSGRSGADGKIQLDLSNGATLIRLTGLFAGREQDLIRIQR